jgi:hypothetical protein
MAGATTCESANAASPTTVNVIAVPRPSRRAQIAMQTPPQSARKAPPSGREPVASATP